MAVAGCNVYGPYTPFDSDRVLHSAAKRIDRRIELARHDILQQRSNNAQAQVSRDIVPSYAALKKWLRGIGQITLEGREGEVEIHDEMASLLKTHIGT